MTGGGLVILCYTRVIRAPIEKADDRSPLAKQKSRLLIFPWFRLFDRCSPEADISPRLRKCVGGIVSAGRIDSPAISHRCSSRCFVKNDSKLLDDAAELELSIRSKSRMSRRRVLREIDEGTAVTSASVHS